MEMNRPANQPTTARTNNTSASRNIQHWKIYPVRQDTNKQQEIKDNI